MTKYEKMINYLIQEDDFCYREDIKQELILLVWQLLLKIEQGLLKPQNTDYYIFICLKRKNQQLNQYYRKTFSLVFVEANEIVDDKRNDARLLIFIHRLALNHLTKQEYDIYELYFKEGYRIQDIAKRYGVSYQSVYRRIQKIIEKIKKIIF